MAATSVFLDSSETILFASSEPSRAMRSYHATYQKRPRGDGITGPHPCPDVDARDPNPKRHAADIAIQKKHDDPLYSVSISSSSSSSSSSPSSSSSSYSCCALASTSTSGTMSRLDAVIPVTSVIPSVSLRSTIAKPHAQARLQAQVQKVSGLPSSGWSLASYHVHPLHWVTVDSKKYIAHMHTWCHYHRERNLRDLGYSPAHCGNTSIRVDDDEHDLITCLDEVATPQAVPSRPMFRSRSVRIGRHSPRHARHSPTRRVCKDLVRKQTIGPGGKFAMPVTHLQKGRYQIRSFLGCGASSVVVACTDTTIPTTTPTATPMAATTATTTMTTTTVCPVPAGATVVKVVAVKIAKAAPIPAAFLLNEIAILTAIRHYACKPTDAISQQGKQHILPLLDSFFDLGHVCAVMPRAVCTVADEFSLQRRRRRHQSPSPSSSPPPASSMDRIVEVARQVLSALAFLEEVTSAGGKRGIYHGDLKPDNILVRASHPIISVRPDSVHPIPPVSVPAAHLASSSASSCSASAPTTTIVAPTILRRPRPLSPQPHPSSRQQPPPPPKVSDGIHVMLADLGLASFGKMERTRSAASYVQTRWLRAPEVLLGTTEIDRSCPMDMWSLGCTLIALFTGVYLFSGNTSRETLLQIAGVLSTYDSAVPDHMIVQSMNGPEWFMSSLWSLPLPSSSFSLFPVPAFSSSSSLSLSSWSSSLTALLPHSEPQQPTTTVLVPPITMTLLPSLPIMAPTPASISLLPPPKRTSAFTKPVVPRSVASVGTTVGPTIGCMPPPASRMSDAGILHRARIHQEQSEYESAQKSSDPIRRCYGLTLVAFLRQNPEFDDANVQCRALHDLILAMLEIDPRRRIRPRAALEHPLFTPL